MKAYLRSLRHALDNHGLVGVLRRAFGKLSDTAEDSQVSEPVWEQMPHPFDREHGTDTGGYIPGAQLASGQRSDFYNTAYYGISPSTLHAALEYLPPAAFEATFVDLGCGKGRALLVAAAFAFPQVLGVELSPTLARIAVRNCAAEPRIRVHQNDATLFPYPETPLVVFLYHPFLAPILRRALRNLERQLDLAPRPAWVLMANPSYPEVFARFRFLRPVWETTFPLSPEDAAADRHGTTGERYILYEARSS